MHFLGSIAVGLVPHALQSKLTICMGLMLLSNLRDIHIQDHSILSAMSIDEFKEMVKSGGLSCHELQAEYQFKVQLLEIYNEQLRDLLDDVKTQKKLDIRNTERSGLNVPDAIQVRYSIHLVWQGIVI